MYMKITMSLHSNLAFRNLQCISGILSEHFHVVGLSPLSEILAVNIVQVYCEYIGQTISYF